MKNQDTIKKDIKSYWSKKEQLKQKAKNHNLEMLNKEKDSIDYSIKNSFIYTNVKLDIKKGNPENIFLNTDSVSALKQYKDNPNICILNFASYKYPGGGFLNGSSAQEESLCHESTLYEVISNKKFDDYYNWNRQNLNKGLYLNRAIYSKKIKFSEGIYCDVLTCASPNWGPAMNWVSKEENNKIFFERCQFVANILNLNKVETFITGAFGCGVFGQDPNALCEIWKNINWGCVNKVIYAIPGNNENATIFQSHFDR